MKSFSDPQVAVLAPITLLYGANSSGKSTVLQSLLLLKQSLGRRTLVTQSGLTDAGSFAGLLFEHDLTRRLNIGLTYGAANGWDIDIPRPDPSLLRSVSVHFVADGAGQPRLDEADLEFGPVGMSFASASAEDDLAAGEGEVALSLDQAEAVFAAFADSTLLYTDEGAWRSGDQERVPSRARTARRVARQLRNAGYTEIPYGVSSLLPDYPLVDFDRMPSGQEQNVVRSYVNRLNQLATGVSTEFERLLRDLIYLGPLRSAPRRFYERTSAGDMKSTGGEEVALYLFDNRSQLERVNDWLDALGIKYELDVVPVHAGTTPVVGDLVSLVLRDTQSGVEVSPADVGFGVSQILPIVVQLLGCVEQVICVEQPEIHLHPKLQTELAELLIASTRETAGANQVIVETHSEHILLRLQRRIREGSLPAEDVSVLYVERPDGGHAVIRRLRLDSEGYFLDAWPAGFFDEQLNELFGGLE
jgi:hypothetical protein